MQAAKNLIYINSVKGRRYSELKEISKQLCPVLYLKFSNLV